MPVDIVLRTLGVMAGMYAVGLLVTVMSLASLEAAGIHVAATPTCAPGDCRRVAHHYQPAAAEPSSSGVLATAQLLVSRF